MSNESWAVQPRQRYLGWSGGDSAVTRSDRTHGARNSASVAGLLRLTISDLFLSFVWAWGTHLAYAAAGNRPGFTNAIYIAGRFLLAWLTDRAGGGSTNPLTALTQTSSACGGCYGVLPTGIFRIPAQVAGTTIAIQMFAKAFPGYKPGPFLEVDIYMGAVVQGILAFVMAMVYLNLADMPLFPQTFVSTMTRMVLNQLGTGSTNGWLNPASMFGWTYHNGTHTAKERIVVYWVAPVLATLYAIRFNNSFVQRHDSGSRWRSD